MWFGPSYSFHDTKISTVKDGASMKFKNVAVFIGTDKYLKFLPSWYESCEEKLMLGVDKKYFVFTDGEVSGVLEY